MHDNKNNLVKGKDYELRQSVWNEEDCIGTRGDRVQILGKTDNVMGVDIYRVYIHVYRYIHCMYVHMRV